ncbi:MAG: phosphoribosylanthranilate isomerase [Limnochordales bacterium]|nr:phosphoribosylanthranilate isomerase [Limnochordales bacterium]
MDTSRDADPTLPAIARWEAFCYRSNRRPGVKICGLRDEETLLFTAQAGADAVGLVFYPLSRRFVSLEEARRLVNGLRRGLPPKVQPLVAGLFVRAPVEEVVRYAGELGLDLVQLQGDEDPSYLEQLRQRLEAEGLMTRVLLALACVDATEAVTRLPRLARELAAHGLIDALMVDRRGTLPGGNGLPLEWSRLAALAAGRRTGELPLPWGLAGGLDPRSVEAACRQAEPDFVDVSSGVEKDGRKDGNLIREFIMAVRKVGAI